MNEEILKSDTTKEEIETIIDDLSLIEIDELLDVVSKEME